MDESLQKYLNVNPQLSKLAAWMRAGKQLVGEERRISYAKCALGCAYTGMTGKVLSDEELAWRARSSKEADGSPTLKFMADQLGISRSLASRISVRHLSGITALEIADELERGELS